MTIDDQQIDQLLRDVPVPEELKPGLHSIPDEHGIADEHGISDGPVQKEWSGWKRPAVVASILIAASILILAAVIIDPLSLRQPVVDEGKERDPGNSALANENKKEAETVRQQMNRIQEATAQIDALTRQFELQIRQQKLANLNGQITEPLIDPDDQESLILTLSGQSALERGADKQTVYAQWQQVIRDYPDSAGSALATQLMEDSKSN